MRSTTIGGVRINVRDSTPSRLQGDINVANEVIVHDVYRISQMPKTARSAAIIVDVGAHIGSFLKRMRKVNPHFCYFGFEACPENWEPLHANAEERDTIVGKAVDYGGPKMLLNSVLSNNSTGGSIVVDKRRVDAGEFDRQKTYKVDRRPIECITLSEIIDQYKLRKIDILKLDCEGAERRIFEHDREAMEIVRHVVGEWHGKQVPAMIRREFPGWSFQVLENHHGGSQGIFWLFHPRRFEP